MRFNDEKKIDGFYFNFVSLIHALHDTLHDIFSFRSRNRYNLPYFPEHIARMGLPALVAAQGEDYSYANTSRARIFRREQAAAVSLDAEARGRGGGLDASC